MKVRNLAAEKMNPYKVLKNTDGAFSKYLRSVRILAGQEANTIRFSSCLIFYGDMFGYRAEDLDGTEVCESQRNLTLHHDRARWAT